MVFHDYVTVSNESIFIMRKIFRQAYPLWRYDLDEPPKSWDNDYHSREYTYPDAVESMRHKNKIGAHYFYDNKSQAFLTGSTALNNSGKNEFWISETSIIPEIMLLDIRKHVDRHGEEVEHDTPLKIISRLDEIGLDVLSDSFCKFLDIQGNRVPLSVMRPVYAEIQFLVDKSDKNLREVHRLNELATSINDFFHNNIGYTGQLLTDFSNGTVFKERLSAMGYDGYIFEDETHTHRPTYCIFDHRNLTAPVSEKAYRL